MKLRILSAVISVVCLVSACETTTTVNGQPVSDPVGVNESDPAKRANIRLQLAANYYQQRQYQVAIDEAKRALEIDANSAAAYGMLGLIYMDLDDRVNAETNFERALKSDPNNSEINNNYGWFLCRTGRQRLAIDYFQRAAANRLYATPAIPLRNAGVCLFQLRDYNGAEVFFKRSFELDASSLVTKFQLTRLYLTLRQLDKANFYYSLLERDFEPTAETLWLGVRLAHATGDVRGEQQYAEQLRRRFANSNEAALLRRGAFDE